MVTSVVLEIMSIRLLPMQIVYIIYIIIIYMYVGFFMLCCAVDIDANMYLQFQCGSALCDFRPFLRVKVTLRPTKYTYCGNGSLTMLRTTFSTTNLLCNPSFRHLTTGQGYGDFYV